MANSSKRKGDQGEREAVAVLTGLLPASLLVRRPMRMLAAGRREDEGDLDVIAGVSVQVKTWAGLSRACREAADGAVEQAATVGNPTHLGMAPIPRASTAPGSLRWLAIAYDWPGGMEQWEPIVTFGTTALAIKHLRDGYGGRVPLDLRMAKVSVRGRKPMFVAPIEAWTTCWVEQTVPGLRPVVADQREGGVA